MGIATALILTGAGLAGGFIAGLVGVGGGIIFAPVLFATFQHTGVDAATLAPLTIGTSLLCTLLAASSSAWSQYKKQSVDTGVALRVGASSAFAVILMTWLVTTQSWYDGTAFQVVFSIVLLIVAVRMAMEYSSQSEPSNGFALPRLKSAFALAGVGALAGMVASAAGVGGGVILVPAFTNLFRMPIRRAVGTSSAAITIISFVGIINYVFTGLQTETPGSAIGYVDWSYGLLLALPALAGARLGVWASHRIDRRLLRISFAVIAGVVACRILIGVL